MKNLQKLVDIHESCGNMDTQTNDEVVIVKGVISCGVPYQSKNETIKRAKHNIEVNAKKLLEARGVDIKALDNYYFGKSVAFALCYGAGTATAKSVGLQSVKRINYATLASNEMLIRSFAHDQSKYTMYDPIVKAVYSGKLEKARKIAVDMWKKRMASNLVQDSETLKKLVVDGCITRNSGVQCESQRGATEITLEFIEQVVDVVNQI